MIGRLKTLSFLFIFISNAAAHVDLIYPVGGEEIFIGDTLEIEWEIVITHNLENWDIYFSDNGGQSWSTIELDYSKDSLKYKWIIFNNKTQEARIKVIMDNAGADYEAISGNFTVLDSALLHVSDRYDNTPKIFSLYQNYPNPFNSYTTISFNLSALDGVILNIYDLRGLRVKQINYSPLSTGLNSVIWNGTNQQGNPVSSGLYLYQVQGRKFTGIRKMLFLK